MCVTGAKECRRQHGGAWWCRYCFPRITFRPLPSGLSIPPSCPCYCFHTSLTVSSFLSLVQVKSLVPGGAAEKSCAVEVGHQIIAIGDNDVSSSTLEEVSISHLYILAHLLVSRYIGLSLDIINGLSDIFGRDNCSWFFWQHAGLCN